RGRKARSKRAPVPAVGRMVDDAQVVRVDALHLVEDRGRVVRAPVVDDDHLVVGREGTGRPHLLDHPAGDRAAVVVGRGDVAEAGGVYAAPPAVCGRTRPCFSVSRHGVLSDSSRTPDESFDAPSRRSMKMMGDSAMVRPLTAARNVSSTTNE